MYQQYMVAPDHEQASLRHANSSTTRSWKSLPSKDERGSSPADVSCIGHESMDTTRSFLENPHQTLISNHEGGRLSAILWSSRSMNSPKLQQQRDEHHIDSRESALWQIESDSSSAGASSSLLHQKDSPQITLTQSPMSPLFLVGDGNSRNKKNQEETFPERSRSPGKFLQTVHGTIDHHEQDDRHTAILGHTSCVYAHSTGSHAPTTSIGQRYTKWVTSTAFVGPTTSSHLIEGRELLTSLSQQQEQPPMTVMNTSGTVRNGDSMWGKEGLQALDHMTAAILNARETTLNQLGSKAAGSDKNSMVHSRIENEVSHDGPPFGLKYCPLQHVEHVQHLCIKEGSPLKLPHIVPLTSMMMLQQAAGCDKMAPYIFKAMQSWHAQEQPIQESALPHLCEESSHNNYPSGIFRQQEDKVGYHDKSANELEKSDLFCHDNLSLCVYEDNHVMPRPFHPAIGRPQVVIPSSRCLATKLEEDLSQQTLASKGTMKNLQDPEIEQADKTVTLLFPERASTYQSSPLPLTLLASRLQSIMHGRTNNLSGFQQSQHVTDFVVSTRASKEDDYCGDDEAPSQVSRKQDPQTCSAFSVSHKHGDDSSSIPCRMPSNNESFAKRTIAPRDHVTGNATSTPSTLCYENVERKNVAISIDIENNITQTKATTLAVKPLNAYNYFYSEMREGILQLNEAEMDMLILNKVKHDDTNHNHSCPGRNYTFYQPGLLAHTILRKQHARFSKAERKRMLLSKHWNKDRTTRRKHRTKYGKISFNRMNTIVSTEWNFLPETQKMFYKQVAEADSKHYKEHQAEMSMKSC